MTTEATCPRCGAAKRERIDGRLENEHVTDSSLCRLTQVVNLTAQLAERLREIERLRAGVELALGRSSGDCSGEPDDCPKCMERDEYVRRLRAALAAQEGSEG